MILGMEVVHAEVIKGRPIDQVLFWLSTDWAKEAVRLDTRDLAALKSLAEREGLPYQTLLSSVLHKYVSGSLVDVNEARKLYQLKAGKPA